jgi:hypothetical protein
VQTHDANRVAVGGHTRRVRDALLRLGMRRCSLRLVQYQFEPDPIRPSWYCLFWRWFHALWVAHRAGAEFLFEDFLARVEALRGAERPAPHGWPEQVARVVRECGEAVEASVLARDEARIRKEVTEAIRELRRLLAMSVAKGADTRRAA